MKTATIIFRTTPENKAQLAKEFEASKKAAFEKYQKAYTSKAMDQYWEHPKNLGSWVETCALAESSSRVKNLKALEQRKVGRK